MKVIFLDVDHVLNFPKCGVYFENYYFVVDEKIKLLKTLVDATGAEIVLSSTWREGWYEKDLGLHTQNVRMFEALENKMKEYDLSFIGYTPNIDYYSRGKEIVQWLSEWDKEPIESFVILDDLEPYYMEPVKEHLVQTSYREGLLPEHIVEAKKILEKKVV